MSESDRPTIKQRLVYAIDLILGKGVLGFFFLAVAGSLLLLAVLEPARLIVQMLLTGQGSWSQLPNMIWTDFTKVLKLGSAQGAWLDQLVETLVALLGIFFAGILFSIVVRNTRSKLKKLSETGNQIIAQHHTAILGWSGISQTVVEQLVVANENRHKPAIAVLDTQSKVANEQSIQDTDTRNTKVLFRKGKPTSPKDLDIIRVDLADRVIVLGDWGADNYDEGIVTQLLALSRYKEKHPQWRGSAVALIKNSFNYGPASIAATFPLAIIDVGQFVSRLMLRTTLQPGIYSVYADLFSFEGDELYFVREPRLTGKTLGDALLAYPNSSPVGIKTGEGVFLHPDLSTVIGPEDQLVVITRDDDTAVIGDVQQIDESAIAVAFPHAGMQQPTGSSTWLFVGWSPMLSDILNELSSYVTESVDVELVCRQDDVARIDANTAMSRINMTVRCWPDHVDACSMLHERNISAFDYVLIFNQRTEPETRDSSTMMVMLQASSIANSLPAENRPTIVTELVEPKFRKLCEGGDGDIVVNSEMVALLAAQVSENPDLLPIYTDLCDASGSEIYLKEIGGYVKPGPANYATLVEAARRRGEIAIGFRCKASAANAKDNFGIRINVDKNTVINVEPEDQLIVVAEDQF